MVLMVIMFSIKAQRGIVNNILVNLFMLLLNLYVSLIEFEIFSGFFKGRLFVTCPTGINGNSNAQS